MDLVFFGGAICEVLDTGGWDHYVWIYNYNNNDNNNNNLPAFKIVKYFWWSSLFVISIVPQLFVNVAILLVFNKENEIMGFYWVHQASLVYPHVGIHPWGPLSILQWGCENMFE